MEYSGGVKLLALITSNLHCGGGTHLTLYSLANPLRNKVIVFIHLNRFSDPVVCLFKIPGVGVWLWLLLESFPKRCIICIIILELGGLQLTQLADGSGWMVDPVCPHTCSSLSSHRHTLLFSAFDGMTDWATQYWLPALRNLFSSVVGLSTLVVTCSGMMASIQIKSPDLCPINLQVSLASTLAHSKTVLISFAGKWERFSQC